VELSTRARLLRTHPRVPSRARTRADQQQTVLWAPKSGHDLRLRCELLKVEPRYPQKIIGHGWSAIRFGLAGSRRVDLIFLEPLVEQGVDLLSKVGGVAQPRQFIILQTIEKRKAKIPREAYQKKSNTTL
jgi:hypothetical protein